MYFKFFFFIATQITLIVIIELLLISNPIKFYYTSVIKDLGNLSTSLYAEKDAIYGYSLKKNVTVQEYQINSLGFRSFEFSKKKPENTFRIFFVGGSTTFGSNAGGNKYTIPDILNYILNSKTKLYNFEVINAGVFGYSTWQNKLKVKEILSYEPDLVFIMDGFTDAVRANDLSYKQIKNFTSENDKQLYEMSEAQNIFVNFLNQQFEIVKLIKYLATKYQKSQLSSLDKEEIKENFTLKEKLELFQTENNLSQAVNDLTKNNIKVAILKNPFLIDTKERYQNIKSNIINSKFLQDVDANWYIASYNEIYKILDQVCEKLNIHCIDLQKTFKKINDKNFPQLLFSDPFHFNRYGNFLIAKDLFQFIFSHQKVFFSDEDILNLPNYSDQYYNKFIKFVPNVGTEFLKNESIKYKKISSSKQFQLTDKKDFFAVGDNRYWNALTFDSNFENTISLELEDEINQFYFYPRVFDKDSYVKLYSDNHLIFELNGEYNDISGIANYYLVSTNFKFKNVKIVKKNAELWFRGDINNFFFSII